MRTLLWVLVVAFVWSASGLGTAYLLARFGHRDPAWIIVCVVLGPLSLPIMLDRMERVPRPVSSHVRATRAVGGVRVVVGVDGSEGSEQALRSVVRAFAGAPVHFVLVEVVDFDAAARSAADGETARAERRLAGFEAEFASVESTHVIAGRPAPALARTASEQSANLIVVGRRGRGMSVRLLGSVAEAILRETDLPVLVGPRSFGRSSPAGARCVGTDGKIGEPGAQ